MKKPQYNLVIIGAGPAGLMAAGHAGQLGHKVILLEKNKLAGIKLSMTGNGRCNLTNAEPNLRKLIDSYGKNGKFLYPSFHNFSNLDLINFFEKQGLKTKIENNQRVFPISNKSQEVIQILKNYLTVNRVKIQFESNVKEIVFKSNHIEKIILADNQIVTADKYLIATGGKAYPATGSTGDAYLWLQEMGHKIIEPKPGLSPIIVRENFVKDLEGLSLSNIEFTLWQDKKITTCLGDAIFTNNGLSGPAVFNMNKKIHEINSKPITIRINFFPNLNYQSLDKKIIQLLSASPHTQIKNTLEKILPKRLIPIIIKLSSIAETKKAGEITKPERKNIIKHIQSFALNFASLAGFDKAMVTCGGVDLKEIDPKTMKSKIIDNLYLAGEILDIDGPTGGYNLQIAWSTGYLAGEMK